MKDGGYHLVLLAENEKGWSNLLVLCSGWTDLKHPERPKQDRFRDAVLRPWGLPLK